MALIAAFVVIIATAMMIVATTVVVIAAAMVIVATTVVVVIMVVVVMVVTAAIVATAVVATAVVATAVVAAAGVAAAAGAAIITAATGPARRTVTIAARALIVARRAVGHADDRRRQRRTLVKLVRGEDLAPVQSNATALIIGTGQRTALCGRHHRSNRRLGMPRQVK